MCIRDRIQHDGDVLFVEHAVEPGLFKLVDGNGSGCLLYTSQVSQNFGVQCIQGFGTVNGDDRNSALNFSCLLYTSRCYSVRPYLPVCCSYL